MFNYLVRKLQHLPFEFYYLIDSRNPTQYPENMLANMTIIEPTYWKRHLFYVGHKDSFDIVFTFNNLPPSIKIKNAFVYTYFHQRFYLESSKVGLSFKNRILFIVKKLILKLTIRNSNAFCVQTEKVKMELNRKFRVKKEAILVFPFFEELSLEFQVNSLKNDFGFIYISEGYRHKNHKRLLKAWSIINSNYPEAKLLLTISKERFPELCEHIEQLKKKGVNVSNVGFLGQTEMYTLYKENRFLIYPSLAESFGLGLIEATQFKCEIIAADLSYVKEVVEPYAVFNPLDFQSIATVVIESLRNWDNTGRTKRIVENKVNDMVRYITQLD